MAEFCTTYYPQAIEEYHELFKFDALMSEQGSIRPEFLPWNQVNQAMDDQWAEHKTAFWRDSNRVSRYLLNFKFTTWRNVKKSYHIEVFSVDIPAYLQTNESLVKQEVAVLFSYEDTQPSYQVINNDDFGNKI